MFVFGRMLILEIPWGMQRSCSTTGLFHEEKINVGKRPLCRELWMLYKNPITLDFLRL